MSMQHSSRTEGITVSSEPDQRGGGLSEDLDLSRTRRTIAAAKDKAAAGAAQIGDKAPLQVRRAGQAVRSHPVRFAAAALTVAGAAAALVLRRRRAAKSRAVSSRWRPGFLKR